VYALNVVLSTATDLWALRYPSTHELFVLARPAGGTVSSEPLDARTARIHARSDALARQPSVIVATERMDGDPGWRLLEPGELVHIDSGLRIRSSQPFAPEPAHLLALADLDPATAASQHPDRDRQVP
jgi:glutamine amidotransferase